VSSISQHWEYGCQKEKRMLLKIAKGKAGSELELEGYNGQNKNGKGNKEIIG